MSTRQQRDKVVISRSTNQPIVNLKQTKVSDWLGSKSSSNSKEKLTNSDTSIRSCSSSSSLDPPNRATSTPATKVSNELKKSSTPTESTHELSPTVVVQLEDILTCDIPECNFQTSFKVTLERHKKIMHELKRLKCPDCDFVTHSERALNQHSSTHDSKVPFKCQLCPWRTTVRYLLTQHIKRHESARLREQGISRASEFGKRFKCSKCDFRAVSKKEVYNHNYSHEMERKYKCTFPGCDHRSKRAPTFKEHVKKHDLAAKKEIQCPLCSRFFWTRDALCKHIASHTKERTVKCTKCNYVTNYPSILKKHMLTHDKKSNVAADKQNSGESLEVLNDEESQVTSNAPYTNTNSDLSERGKFTTPITKKRKHILEKKYKCDQCDFKAINKHKIIRHAVVHRDPDDKIYSCSFPGCDFKTNWEDYLKKHRRNLHKSTTDHMCPVEGCDFQTKWQETLAKHKKKIHERRKRNHQCMMCRKAFYDIYELNRHINVHTGESKYKCSLCDYVSTVVSNVKAHGRKHHAGQPWEPKKVT